MKQFTTPEELDLLPDHTVVLLFSKGDGVAAQRNNGFWFVVGADPMGQTAFEMASHAPRYGLTFKGIVLWEPDHA